MATSCNIDFSTLLNIGSDKGKFASAIPKNMSFDERLNLIDFIHDKTELVSNTHYEFGGFKMPVRVSTLASNLFQSKGGVDKTATPDGIIQTSLGNAVHDIAAHAGKILEANPTANVAYIINNVRPKVDREHAVAPLSDDIYATIIETVREIINLGNETQATIDPSRKATFRFETKVIDPKTGIGGTGDVFIFYSDGSASYFDFKTFEPGAEFKSHDESSNSTLVSSFASYRDYRREKWELTVPAYTKILKDVYRVTSIRHARAIPIAVMFEKTEEYIAAVKSNNKLKMDALFEAGKTRTNKIRNLESFVNSDYLVPVVTTEEDLTSAQLTQFVIDRFKEIRELEDRIQRSKDASEIKRLAEKKERVKLLIDRISFNQDVAATFDLVKSVLIEVEQVLKPDFPGDRLPTIVELRKQLIYYKDAVMFLSRMLTVDTGKTTEENAKMIGDVTVSISNALNSLDTVFLNEMETHNLVHESISRQEIDTKQILFEQDDIIQHWSKGAINSNNPFFRQMKETVDKIELQTKKDLDKFMKEAEKKFAGLHAFLKQKGWSEEQFIDFIINKKTGNLQSKFSKTMYDIINAEISNRNASFFQTNYVIRDNYQASYERRLANREAQLRVKYHNLDSEQNKAGYARELESWKDKNALINDDGSYNDLAWTQIKNVSRFLKRKESFESKYYSDAYKTISTDARFKDWYDFWLQSMYEFSDMLGGHDNVTGNFVPWIQKDFIELAFAKGGKLAGSMLDSISVNFDNVAEEYDSLGNIVKRVPVLYTNRFLKTDGSVDFERKSFNLEKSLHLFAKMVFNYNNKIKHEAHVMAIREMMVDFGQVIQTSKKSVAITNPANGKTYSLDVNQNLQETFDAYVNFYMYGMRISDKDKTFNLGNREISMQRALLAAKNFYTKKTLAYSIHPPIASYVVGKLGSRVAAKKGLLFDNENLSFGNKLWAKSKLSKFVGADSDTKKYKAFLAYFNPNQFEDFYERIDKMSSNKLDRVLNDRAQFAFFHWADQGVVDPLAVAISKHYGIKNGQLRHKDNLDKDSKTLWDSFTIKEVDGEVVMDIAGNLTEEQKDKILIKFRRIVREAQQAIIGNASDEEISLASTSLLGNLMLQYRTWLPNIANEMFKGLKYDETYDAVDIGRFTAFADSYRGSKSGSGFMLIAKDILSITTKLIGEIFYLGRAFNYDRTLIDEERSRNVFEEWKAKHPKLAERVTYEQYLQARKRQMIAMISHIRMLAMLLGITMLAGADWDDDDEKDYRKTFVTRHAFRILNRVYTEAASFYSPMELNSLLKGGPIPVWGLPVAIGKIFANGLDEIRDSVFGENAANDKTPAFYYSLDMIPIVDRFRKIFELTESDLAAIR